MISANITSRHFSICILEYIQVIREWAMELVKIKAMEHSSGVFPVICLIDIFLQPTHPIQLISKLVGHLACTRFSRTRVEKLWRYFLSSKQGVLNNDGSLCPSWTWTASWRPSHYICYERQMFRLCSHMTGLSDLHDIYFPLPSNVKHSNSKSHISWRCIQATLFPVTNTGIRTRP